MNVFVLQSKLRNLIIPITGPSVSEHLPTIQSSIVKFPEKLRTRPRCSFLLCHGLKLVAAQIQIWKPSSLKKVVGSKLLAVKEGCIAGYLEIADDNNDGGTPEAIKSPVFLEGKSLSEICTWGIGGPAKYLVEVHTEGQMLNVIRFCHQNGVSFFVVGKGSNCLFDDKGFNGCVIVNRIRFLDEVGNGLFHVGSGSSFNTLGIEMTKRGYSGLEFAGGIPGTVGGAIYMNAGADGQETSEVLESVDFVTVEGKKGTLRRSNGELHFAYRSSPFQRMESSAVIVGATFRLSQSPEARQRQLHLMDKRRKSQPILERTAGCVFRNPGPGHESAGAIIDQLGLKGYSVGGARVSEVHANFLVNEGGSKSSDLLALIAKIQERAKATYGIDLQTEIEYVPFR